MPLATNAVDLSRLPAPDVVEQISYEAIRSGLIADMTARGIDFDAIVESDPVIKLIEVVAFREMLLRQSFNDRARQVMIAFATGSNLDQLGALLGVARLVLTPANAVTGAPAVMEEDELFRRRIVLAPESFSVAGPAPAYVFWALSASADVLDASATSPDPGEVVVSVLARTGIGTASGSLIDKVEAVVNSRPIRPLTDHVTVQSVQIVNFEVDADLILFDGPDSSVVAAAARARLEAWLEDNRRIGRDIPRSALFAALHVEGVQRVILHSPTADLTIGETQSARCTEISVDSTGIGN